MTPSMAVALTALVVALGGTAFAAGGGFASSDDGLVQACVAKADIVNSVTDPVLGAVSSAAAGLLGTVSSSVTPKGTVIVVAPGSKCPANTEPQSLSSTPAVEHAQAKSKTQSVGASKTELTNLMVPAGTTPVRALVDIVQKDAAIVDQTIKCVFVDAAGKTIAGSESAATIPAGSEGMRVTVPMSALVTLSEPTKVGTACKNVTSPATSNGARARATTRRAGKARAAAPDVADMHSQMDY
jgi:hypothetical protein